VNFKGSQFEREIILWGVRWYVAYPISYRQLEEMMGERGVTVDHSTLNRWVIKYAPEFEKQFRRRQRPVGRSWRVDETYVKIKGQWAYLYRAVDRSCPSIVRISLQPANQVVDQQLPPGEGQRYGRPPPLLCPPADSPPAARGYPI
jgi:transposase-like protein